MTNPHITKLKELAKECLFTNIWKDDGSRAIFYSADEVKNLLDYIFSLDEEKGEGEE